MKKKLHPLIMLTKHAIYGVIIQSILASTLLAIDGNAQFVKDLKEVNITLKLRDASFIEAFTTLERKSGFKFNYNIYDLDPAMMLNGDYHGETLYNILLDISRQANVRFKQVNDNISVSPNSKQYGHNKRIEVITQTISVTGRVTSDDNPEGLPGVNVIIKGTAQGTVTDVNGNYKIGVPSSESVLVFSSVGYQKEEISVGSRTVINIALTPDIQALQEIVVVGYGTQKKSDLTGSVVSVQSDQITQTHSTTVEEALAGRASGVQVTQSEGAPGAGVKIRVRGTTSINASNDPLYVIDGFPVQAQTVPTSDGAGGISQTSVLSTMNPGDIASIEVLKDASATAIYGSRGANGVIMITTKSGSGGGQKISFNTYAGVSKVPKLIPVLQRQDFLDYYYWITGTAYIGDNRDYALRDENGDPVLDYVNWRGDNIWKQAPLSTFQQHNWAKEIFRTGAVQDYDLSFSGGGEKNNYLVSVGYYNQKGTVIGSDYERYTANLKEENNFSERFRIGINVNSGFTNNHGILSATQTGKKSSGVMNNLLLFTPILGYDHDGNLLSDQNSTYGEEASNPYKEATQQKLKTYNYYMRSNLYADVNLLSGLDLKVTLGANLSGDKRRSWFPGDFGVGLAAGGGVAILGNDVSLDWLNENTLTYSKQFNKHKIDAVVGFTQQKSSSEGYTLRGTGFQIPSINLDNIASGTITQSGSGSYKAEWGLLSWLGRVNYSFKDRYLFTLTGRADGSSRFPQGSKWALFPSGAFAWRASDEPFMKQLEALSDLKLHASYGLSGNQAIDVYSSLASYSFANYPFGDEVNTGLTAERLQNDALTWETTSQLDVGVDLGLFNNKIYFTAAYYHKLTDNLLLQVNVPYTSGYDMAWKNAGAVENHGMDFSINTVNVTNKDFSWQSSLNISFNRNEVKKLYSDLNYFYVDGPGNPGSAFIVKEGEPLGAMYGFVFDGVYQLDEFNYDPGKTYSELISIKASDGGYDLKEGVVSREGVDVLPGGVKLKDLDGDNVVTNANDRTIIGNANPKFYGGISNDFTFKNFDLSVFMNFSYGNDIYNKNLYDALSQVIPFRNGLDRVKNAWRPDNPTNDLWGESGLTYGGAGGSMSYYVEDGSFLRLANVTLGYNLPQTLIGKWKLTNARIYVSGDNLHVWTKYSGYDPEVSVGFDNLAPGVDFGAYPRSRTFRVGVKLDF